MQEQDKNNLNVHQYNLANQINIAGIISDFACEWIDNEQSPKRISQRNFPLENQLDSSLHYKIELNRLEDLSLNQIRRNQNEENIQFNENENSIFEDSFQKAHVSNILGNQLDIMDNSISREYIFSDNKIRSEQNIFQDQISEIILPPEYNIIDEGQVNIEGKQGFNKEKQFEQIQFKEEIKLKEILPNNEQPQNNNEEVNIDLNLSNKILDQHESAQTQKSQNTITINDLSFASKIYEQLFSIEQSSSLKSMVVFLENNESSYHSFYLILEQMFLFTKPISQRSLQNALMYVDFFQEKYQSLEKYLLELTNQKTQKIYQQLKNKQINNLVYVDSKIVLREIHEKSVKKAKFYKIFLKQIGSVYKDLNQSVKKIKQKRINIEKNIQNYVKSIKEFESDLEKIIQYEVDCKKNKNSLTYENFKEVFKVDNFHLYKDNYLQIKFIVQKQDHYLKQLKDLRSQAIKYFNSVYLTDEIYISTKIKENMVNYTQSLLQMQKKQEEIYQNNPTKQQNTKPIIQKKDALLNQKIVEQIKIEMGKIFFECIPNSIIEELGLSTIFNLSLTSEKLLQRLNDHFQNEVFIKSIELEESFIYFKSQGSWISKAPSQNNKESISSKNSDKISEKVTIILTVDKFLHMQIEQKIATMKLNEVKISKKRNQIIILDRGKGIVGYLVNNGNQLGRIQFLTVELANEFTTKLKQIIQKN